MSIHILSQNPEVRTRLAAFLDEIGKEYVFHDNLTTLGKKLTRLKKTDAVLYDLQLEEKIWAFEPLYLGSRKTHMVVFESSDTGSASYSPMGNEHYLILSQNDARAKARLVTLFHELTKLSAPRKAAKKKAKKKVVAKKKTETVAVNTVTAVTQSPKIEALAPRQGTRYLQATSDIMQSFVADLKKVTGKEQFLILQGDDGAEFELAAREINYQDNGDIRPLIVLDPMQLDADELAAIEEEARKAKVTQYCYLGLTLELNNHSANQIAIFLGHLKMQLKDENIYLHLILGNELGSESCYPDNIRPILEEVQKISHILELPGMAERKEDIAAIAYTIFSMLRMAHPFLQSRTIDSSAIRHLESECASLDYSRITRVLRNAMALGTCPTLSEGVLKSFSDNSPTTQHLMESLADEKFFPSAQ